MRWCIALLMPAVWGPVLAASDIDSSALQKDSATVLSASGQISTERKGQDWAVAAGEHIPVTYPLFTGEDGYARFQVAGGSTFELFAHTHATFRENPGNPQDLLDLETGRVRIQVQLSAEQPLQTHVRTPVAIISCHGPAAFAIAVDDEDNTTRVDVQQGEILVQHTLLPRAQPVIVKAGDAISVQSDEPLISRRLDRGSLYRYAFHTIWKTLGSAIPGLSGKGEKEGDTEAEFIALARQHFLR